MALMPGEPQAEAVEVLRRLIRFNTVNPPGDERAAQEYLAAHLEDAGLECRLLGAEEGRPNLIARLRGDRPDAGPTLGLLGHVDTVLATPAEWEHDPWSGDEVDGFVWGRGALDMKSQVAAEVAAVASLARSGWRPPRGEVLLMAVVDEETGGALGARWLCENHAEEVRCDYLINEGAGPVFEHEGQRLYGVCTAEKGVFRFSVRTHGRAGHASVPRMADNALLKLAPVIDALAAGAAREFDLTDAPAALLRELGQDPDDPARAIELLREASPVIALMVEPMLQVTFAPTVIRASEKINVIPSQAELQVDCRVPPGLGEAEARRRIEGALRDVGEHEVEFLDRVVGNESLPQSPLMDAIAEWIPAQDPGARTVPIMLPAFTDSRHFRDAFPDIVAYGFFPQRHQGLLETWPLIHSADERIDVRDLGFAAGCYVDLARKLLG
jgi:acetylornithine deacetylase/succinyl-diaminopimelate desuccinylase-like protein